jgi:hypothetical protein
LVAGNGTAASANQFYMNVYATIDDSTFFYDCRFDYVPATGSTAAFTTASFMTTDTPVNVQRRGSARIASCPATLAGMPEGSHIRAFSLSVGDTSTGDVGLAGYLDKVVVSKTSETTTYDFEPTLTYPSTYADCKNNGWRTFTGVTFKNESKCRDYVKSKAKEVKGNMQYTAYELKRKANFKMNTADNDGKFDYSDANGNWYKVEISSVKVSNKLGWFAGRVKTASNPAWVGQWLFGKVENDGGSDKIWGSFTDETTAKNGVKNMTSPADGPFSFTKGELKIRSL